jgi:hypothetical protein
LSATLHVLRSARSHIPTHPDAARLLRPSCIADVEGKTRSAGRTGRWGTGY